MNIKEDLLYTKDHEWIKITDKIITLGITDFAQSELGDIIFVELPSINDNVNKGDSLGTIEAVKTVADLYTPVSGKIIEVNSMIEEDPELMNSAPYDNGWIVMIESKEPIFLDDFLNSDDYLKFIGA